MPNITINNAYHDKLPVVREISTSLQRIFKQSPKNIIIKVLPDRQSMEKMLHRALMPWEVAVTKQNTILILNPVTAHERRITLHNLDTILCHELVHVFYNSLIPEGIPYWLNEGLAYCLAKQKFKTYSYPTVAKRALLYYSHFHTNIYRYGPALTNLLIQRNSMDTLMRAITIFSRTSHHPKEFYKIFQPLLEKLPANVHP